MFHLVLTPVGGYLLVALVSAVLLGLLRLGPGQNRVTRRRRMALIGVRLLIILLLILAMLRPTLVHSTRTRKSATLVLMLDFSRSMEVADAAGNKKRFDAMLASLAESDKALHELLSKEVELKVYGFDAENHTIDFTGKDTLWPTKPNGRQTAIGACLEDILKRETGKRLAAVVLLSDGAQRVLPAKDVAPQMPARRLQELGYPLYAVPFGQARGAGQTRDVKLSDLRATPLVFVKNQLDVSAVVEMEGFVNQEVVAQLLVETAPGVMTVVDSVKVKSKQNGDRHPIELKYTPQIAGEMKVQVKVEPQTGELVVANNELSTFVTVLDGGLRVLYLDGARLWEQKFLRRSLDASPDIDVDEFIIDPRKKETRPNDLAALFQPGKYDVYLFGDLDATAFTDQELIELRAAINAGSGFMMLGGIHSFGAGGYGQTALADVLPLVMDRLERQNFGEPIRPDLHLPIDSKPKMRPTRAGAAHSLMQLAPGADNAKAWDALPSLEGANRFTKITPGATVLGETTDGKPLLVARDFGRGRVLAFAGDSTWRWQMAGHEAAHKRFWRQVILWLSHKDEASDNSVWVKLDERRFSPGARVEFSAGARGPNGEPIADAQYDAEVVRPDGSRMPARMRHEGEDAAGMFLDAAMPGDYTLIVKGRRGAQQLGSAQARFLVFDQDLELDNPAADRGALESLAAMTSGRTIPPEQLPDFFAQLKEQLKDLEVETLIKHTLWDGWPFFLIMVALLALEWWWRKKWGLV